MNNHLQRLNLTCLLATSLVVLVACSGGGDGSGSSSNDASVVGGFPVPVGDGPVAGGGSPSAEVDEPVDEPVDVPADDPVSVTVEEPVVEPVDVPVDAPEDVPVEEPVDEPVAEPVVEPVSEDVVAVDDDPPSEVVEADPVPETEEPVEVPTADSPLTTVVYFDITVPAYVSNALQVRLRWGDWDENAAWLGDEFWGVSGEFPTNTERSLRVDFNDGNGAITLGSIQTVLLTGTNASEVYRIDADDFDTDSWDDDADGVSNIDELRAGTDPLVNEVSELEVRESVARFSALDLIDGYSGHFEEWLPSERPYFRFREEVPIEDFDAERVSSTETIEIDALGNGTYAYDYLWRDRRDLDRTTRVRSGTRLQEGETVTWTGSRAWYNVSAFRGETRELSSTTTRMGDNTFMQSGVLEYLCTGCGSRPDDSVRARYALIGEPSEASDWCVPTSGTIERENGVFADGRLITVPFADLSISKEPDADHWHVIEYEISEGEGGEIADEYLADDLGIRFYCGHTF